jgi:hypothetical protein
VFPKNRPYNPTQKELELGQLAKTGVVDPAQFTVYKSKIPTKGPGGGLILPFGTQVYVVASVKNFILEDESGRAVLSVFKSSGGTCTLKVSQPLSSLVAFAVAVAGL